MNVNVNIISNPKYMTNQKTFSNFIKEISYYKSVLPVKYKHYFDEISSLYLQRKIEKQSEVHKLLNTLSSRGKSSKKAIKLIEKNAMSRE